MVSFKQLLRLGMLCVVVGAGLTQLTACNTTKGAGRDIERAGEKLQDASDSAKK